MCAVSKPTRVYSIRFRIVEYYATGFTFTSIPWFSPKATFCLRASAAGKSVGDNDFYTAASAAAAVSAISSGAVLLSVLTVGPGSPGAAILWRSVPAVVGVRSAATSAAVVIDFSVWVFIYLYVASGSAVIRFRALAGVSMRRVRACTVTPFFTLLAVRTFFGVGNAG